MRKAMTEPEVILWTRLRGRGGELPTFRRQHPFGAIILDFYCPKFRLALEVDGSTHWDDTAQFKDAARDRWLKAQGVLVLRIPASRVYRDIHGVMDEIILTLAELGRDGRSELSLAPSTPRSLVG
jgi:very-short-patch-repair endonuclease